MKRVGIVLRLPPSLHKRLAAGAERDGESLNARMVRFLDVAETRAPTKAPQFVTQFVTHTDEVLRRHWMLLRVYEDGRVALVDGMSGGVVSKKRANAYLDDLRKNPGFPEDAEALAGKLENLKK